MKAEVGRTSRFMMATSFCAFEMNTSRPIGKTAWSYVVRLSMFPHHPPALQQNTTTHHFLMSAEGPTPTYPNSFFSLEHQLWRQPTLVVAHSSSFIEAFSHDLDNIVFFLFPIGLREHAHHPKRYLLAGCLPSQCFPFSWPLRAVRPSWINSWNGS